MDANKKEVAVPFDMLCSSCRIRKKPDSGEWLTFNNNLNRRWICKQCKIKRDANLVKPKGDFGGNKNKGASTSPATEDNTKA